MTGLIPLFTDLGLDEALVYSGADPAGPPPRTKATAVQAVLGAAYLSHDADLGLLSKSFPAPVAEWLRLGVLTAVPGSAVSISVVSEPPPGELTALEKRRARSRASWRRSGREQIFTRSPGEIIMIGNDIVVEVSRILTPNNVRLRFDAPGLPVDRYAIWVQKRERRRRSTPEGRLQPKPERRRRPGPPRTGHKGGLMLTLRPNDTVVIGDTVATRTFVTALSMSDQGPVRLAVDPPEGLPVMTFEAWKEQRNAGATDTEGLA
jgi:sRNA-binding carbon storage regulator CsrA